MGVDDLIDDTEEEKKIEDAKNILDELDVDSKEELEELEDKLDRVQHGLKHYDRRLEKVENELEIYKGVIARLVRIVEQPDEQSQQESVGDGGGGEEDEKDFSWER